MGLACAILVPMLSKIEGYVLRTDPVLGQAWDNDTSLFLQVIYSIHRVTLSLNLRATRHIFVLDFKIYFAQLSSARRCIFGSQVRELGHLAHVGGAYYAITGSCKAKIQSLRRMMILSPS
jgi:hypothetical protein